MAVVVLAPLTLSWLLEVEALAVYAQLLWNDLYPLCFLLSIRNFDCLDDEIIYYVNSYQMLKVESYDMLTKLHYASHCKFPIF